MKYQEKGLIGESATWHALLFFFIDPERNLWYIVIHFLYETGESIQFSRNDVNCY